MKSALASLPFFQNSRARRAAATLLLSFMVSSLGGCALPSLEDRADSQALELEKARETPLGQLISPLVEAHPGLSGIHPLDDAKAAFAARMLMAEAAQQTLDIQYYIWHDDTSGALLFDALRRAADRGVRVRLLIDDNNTVGLDETLAALDSHPDIEVRLFNPFVLRSPRPVGYITDFSRLNRRMHNKSFTIDNQVTVIGGRNIGDEYFGATDDVLFADLDVLAVGPVVQKVSDDFDRYWASQSSYPADRVIDVAQDHDLDLVAEKAGQLRGQQISRAYLLALENSDLVSRLRQGELSFEWADTRMVSDDPAKGLGEVEEQELLTGRLSHLLGEPTQQLDMVSPYFVPMAEGTEWLAGLASSGVRVRVLTNALEATDVTAVHAGYAKRRRDLLEAGVELYELKRSSASDEPTQHTSSFGRFGSSGSSLHAKTFSADREWIFVGSFNLDPRSARINTELGFLIASPRLAGGMDEAFDVRVPEHSYRVALTDDGSMVWYEQTAEGVVTHHSEPNSGLLRRAGVTVMSWLPIDWLL